MLKCKRAKRARRRVHSSTCPFGARGGRPPLAHYDSIFETYRQLIFRRHSLGKTIYGVDSRSSRKDAMQMDRRCVKSKLVTLNSFQRLQNFVEITNMDSETSSE